MGGSAAQVFIEKLSQSPEDLWAAEIRDYLLGRLSSKARIDTLEIPQKSELKHIPVRRWWIFEGKQYTPLGGPIAANWDAIIRKAWQLERTFNPRLRLSDRPDCVVDWGYTLARGPRQVQSEFVVRSSGIGLNEDESAALHGWVDWISNEWLEYSHNIGIEAPLDWYGFRVNEAASATPARLRRWAHTARRSRWPLLRAVVAESLRPVLEPEELDRIPLPSERETLFELLCLVRIAKCVSPAPRELRWLNAETTDNTIRLEGTTCCYQQSLDRDVVLATSEYAGSLGSAVRAFDVSIPRRIDLAFDFDTTWNGFDGLIVEAKSGSQGYDKTISQLRTYRAARSRRSGSRYLVWGIVEDPEGPDTTREHIATLLEHANRTDDLWLFSSAAVIPVVLRTVLTRENAPMLSTIEAA
jgi:hypothetical protein